MLVWMHGGQGEEESCQTARILNLAKTRIIIYIYMIYI